MSPLEPLNLLRFSLTLQRSPKIVDRLVGEALLSVNCEG